VVATINADFEKFVKLTLNGAEVSKDNYSVDVGSTKITLKESYIKTFGNGTYHIVAEFEDGVATITVTVGSESGDDGESCGGCGSITGANGGGFGGTVMLLIALMAAATFIGLRKKKTAH